MTPIFFFLLFISLTAISPGASDNGYQTDESTDISAIIEKANKGLSNLKEGDIMFSRKRNADPCVENGCKWPKSGTIVNIPYKIANHFRRKERTIIDNALETFHQKTCIRFVPYTNQRDYIYFFSGTGCWSYVGRKDNGQPISLNRRGCLFTFIVQHEILHILGFHHEISRSDRDDYIEVKLENVMEGREMNFQKRDTLNQETSYDFDSVMQYGNYAFSKNGEKTIIDISDPDHVFGHAQSMSENDFARVNTLYECEG